MNKRIISFFLIVALLNSSVATCYAENKGQPVPIKEFSSILAEGKEYIEERDEIKSKEPFESLQHSDYWNKYIGDIETFVYGLIIHEFQFIFDTFPASVVLSDGTVIYGIAYTDYSECFANEDGSQYCFEAGFVPFIGESAVSKEDFDSGLYISDLDYSDEQVSFIWTYASAPFKEHCVVYGQYLQYGIDDNGTIFFESADYIPGSCDEHIGALYSFDESKYLLDINFGSYMDITGTSLFSQIDFGELEKEINRIINEQNINLASIDTVSCAYFAQEAIVSYLLSIQEETFLGYSVPLLVEEARKLDPLECYRLTASGLTTIQLDNNTSSSELAKWIVGVSCVIVIAVSTVGSMVSITVPGAPILFGSIGGTAVEIFIQILSGKELNNIDWRKVALSAAAGAISGYLGPYIYSTCSGAAYFAIDTIADALIGGLERAAEAWIDGKDAEGIKSSFGTGIVWGLAISAGIKIVGKIATKVAKAAGPKLTALTEKLMPKLTAKTSACKDKIEKALSKLKRMVDSSPFSSKHLSKKISDRQLERMISDNVDDLMNKSIKRLGVNGMIDVDGNEMTKNILKKLASEAEDGAILGYFKKGDELIQIVKKNSMLGIVFDPEKYQNIIIPGGLTNNRDQNFLRAAEIFKNQWMDNPSLMPESINAAILRKGVDLEEMMPSDLVSIIKKSDLVMHENIDKISITLAPRAIHDIIPHMGGVALDQYMKEHVGREFFDRLVSIIATGTVIVSN